MDVMMKKRWKDVSEGEIKYKYEIENVLHVCSYPSPSEKRSRPALSCASDAAFVLATYREKFEFVDIEDACRIIKLRYCICMKLEQERENIQQIEEALSIINEPT